ncbi:MAG TPA: tetratricopeptide repeat protein [Bacteroidales bacterium]|nr:tetratricopeptide repeat protein [Bacteroidales bacterium]
MEILKRNVGSLLVVLFLLNGATAVTAQDTNKKISAFQESYIREASGELQKAIDALKGIYDEKSYEINLRLGWLTYQSGLFTESLAYYNKAITLMPYSAEARFGLVYPASAMGNWGSVISQYEKILELMPNNTVAMHRLGLIYYGRGEYEKAKKYFEKVVNLYPFDYDGLIMLAWTSYQLKDYGKAKVLFNKALMNTPSGSSAQEGLDLLK